MTMESGARHLARQSAVQALYQWDLTEQSPDHILKHFIEGHDISELDRDYFHLLVKEVPLFHRELEAHIRPALDRDLEDVDPVERAILRLATYELEYRKEIPTKVIIDESIKLAKVFSSELSYKFVNGVLDKVAKDVRGTSETAEE